MPLNAITPQIFDSSSALVRGQTHRPTAKLASDGRAGALTLFHFALKNGLNVEELYRQIVMTDELVLDQPLESQSYDDQTP